ncbi:MAG TPA: porin [Rhizomicrobium sp.]|nr:porin [Rhizomicrobium sp.]
MHKARLSIFLAGTALIALSGPAFAAAKQPLPPPPDPRIGVLEQQLRDLQQQLNEIKGVQKANEGANDYSGAVLDLKRSTSDQYVDLNNRFDAQTKVSIPNGRLTVASPDGAFSLTLRSLIQFDEGYFAQGKNPAGVDLNSGSNFRRAQFGFVGTAFRDWTYNFTYDFGGSGVEKNGYIYYAYVEYDGLKPFGFRIGALAPFDGIEDATGSGDLLFLERPTTSDIARNVAGAPGREGAMLFAQGDNYLLSVAYTGKKTTDAATFDAQQAIVSRASYLAVNTPAVKWLLDGHVSHVLKVADPTASTGPTANVFSFSNGPELAVDSTKTVNTGNIDAKRATEFGFETAASYAGLYGQGGWFHYDIERRSALPNPDFSGWYALLTYSLTGEEHPYDPTTASFRSLRPNNPLGSGGWGAWELKARYSDIDLDYLPFNTAATGGVAGGKQDVWTLGVNWYPTAGLRFELEYDNISVDHVNAPATDISANAIALRTQISL